MSDDPFSLRFRPSKAGCKKCGEIKDLSPSGFCRKTIDCFDRAVMARRKLAIQRLRELFKDHEYAEPEARKKPIRKRRKR